MSHEINFKRLFRCIKNWFFCKKYPFWRLSDSWYTHNTSIYDSRIGKTDFFTLYEYTWYDDIPRGWQKAFGKKLSKEILKTGKLYLKDHKDMKWDDILQFIQIKEKYGALCLYADIIDELAEVLDKYECLSICYCIVCGRPARYQTQGYILYLCEKCFNKCGKVDEEYRDMCRLTEENVPYFVSYDEEELPNSTEIFKTKKEAEKRRDELNDGHEDDDIWYRVEKIKDHKWKVTGFIDIKNKIDLKEKHGIDYHKLWDL